jgi:hypothetical protein
MTSRKTALCIAGGALFVAYLAAANMPSQQADRSDPRVPPPEPVSTATLADEVRSQVTRLQSRMAQAPVPENNPRNPFAFGVVARAARAAPADIRAAVVDEPPAALVPPPALNLMGIAEESVTGGIRRTAVIGGDGDTIFMVTEGETVGGRYKVTKIGADAVELEDVVTKAYRRIALR